MRIEEIVFALQNRQKEMEKSVFGMTSTDPAFCKMQGKYSGLGDAISVISELAQKEKSEDE